MSIEVKCEDGHEVTLQCLEIDSWRNCRKNADHVLCDKHLEEKIEEAVEKATANEYLIWSFEHDAWWMPKHLGYTKDRTEAGRYSHAEAVGIVMSANIHFNAAAGDPIRMPNEAMIPLPV